MDDNCYAARLSGDEFAIFMYGADDNSILESRLKEIYDYMITAQIKVYGKMVDVRLSGGYVFHSKYPEEYDLLLKKAQSPSLKASRTENSSFRTRRRKSVRQHLAHNRVNF